MVANVVVPQTDYVRFAARRRPVTDNLLGESFRMREASSREVARRKSYGLGRLEVGTSERGAAERTLRERAG